MARRLRMRVVKRKEIDEDKLVLALLLVAQQLGEQGAQADDDPEGGKSEAA